MNAQTAFEQAILVNRQAFASLRDEIRSRHAGNYVVLGDGKVLATAPTYDEALGTLRQLPTPPECYFVFEADDEPIFDVVTDYHVNPVGAGRFGLPGDLAHARRLQ